MPLLSPGRTINRDILAEAYKRWPPSSVLVNIPHYSTTSLVFTPQFCHYTRTMAATAESIPTPPGIASDHPLDTFSDEKDNTDIELQAPSSLSDEDSLSQPQMSKPRLVLLFLGYDPHSLLQSP